MGKVVVRGSASTTCQPDTVNFNIHMTKVGEASRELVHYNKTTIDALIQRMDDLDIPEDNLRENSFRITENREYVDGESVMNGYRLDSSYTLFNYIDYELIDGVREALTELGLEFSVSYTLEDEGLVREDLLQEAVQQSKRKAQIIARADNMSIGEMLEVRYGGTEGVATTMLRATAGNGEANPQDIVISESLEVEWELISE